MFSGDEREAIENLCADFWTRILKLHGENPEREGLKDTPGRWAAAFACWTRGLREDPRLFLKTFEDGSEDYDQIILLKDIPLWSLCEHHLAPFFGVAHVGYIPEKKILGLSKMVRIVDNFARRLQVQERLTTQVADFLFDGLKPKGIGVILECRHSCMESRGVQKAGVMTTTSALRGVFLEEKVRLEFLALTKGMAR
jgi:GTP cyclohydrolase IA